MPHLSVLPTLIRESFVTRTLPREPEPDLIMEDSKQVADYAKAGRIDGMMAASYLYQTAQITTTIYGCKKVIDLGCGPATQLAQVARFNPDTQFIGIDLSSEMLVQAEKHVQNLGLKNVEFIESDITNLEKIHSSDVDGVISTMALHHLPDFSLLEKCFAEIQRVLKKDGAIYLTDFSRLKSLKSVLYFAYLNSKYQPHLFSLDYERSLRAAFLDVEFDNLAKNTFGKLVKFYLSKPIPILVIIKTPNQSDLPAELMTEFKHMKAELPKKYLTDLNDIRMLFKFGGLKDDPFK